MLHFAEILLCSETEPHSEPCQTSKMEFLAKIVHGFKLLIVFVKNVILDVWQGSEYVPSLKYVESGIQFYNKNK